MIKITMRVLMGKRTELLQTLLSLVEPTENSKGRLSCQLFTESWR